MLTCNDEGLVKGRLGGGKAAGAGLGTGGAEVLDGLRLPLMPRGWPLLSGTPVAGNVSLGFLGTTAADVDAVVVDPPSDACAHNTCFKTHYKHTITRCELAYNNYYIV